MFIVTFVRHEKTGLDRKQALDHWRTTHGPIAASLSFVEEVVIVG